LSQIPSSYIIKTYASKNKLIREKAKDENFSITWPIETHLWIHDVLARKKSNAQKYRSRIQADEIWLAVHAPSKGARWHLKKFSDWEYQLMRFGAKKLGRYFDRVLVVFGDGEVKSISGDGLPVPDNVAIDMSKGYPTKTVQHCWFTVPVPLDGLGKRRVDFGQVKFTEQHVGPLSSEFKELKPWIDENKLFLWLIVDSNKGTSFVSLDGSTIASKWEFSTKGFAGKSIGLAVSFDRTEGFLSGGRVQVRPKPPGWF